MFNFLRRLPDFIIGGADNPYLLRWFIIPRNRWFNVFLHKFMADDDDRALHCHPWWFVSFIIQGGYWEITPCDWAFHAVTWYGRGSIILRRATHRHRVALTKNKDGQPTPCWTLVITGPRIREWGFWCPQGFVHWKDFTDGKDGERIGKGCDQ